MPRIVTITFSPCIDKSTTVTSLIPEKKLRCSLPKLEPGGGGINVARAMQKLGMEVTAIFPSGGYTGKHFNHLMEKENVTCEIIDTANETRENIIVLDESSNEQYRFGMPGMALSADEWKQCLQALEKLNDVEFVVASGSLPPGVPLNIYAQIAKIAKQKKAKFVVDTSDDALKEAIDEGAYLVKPNLGELSFLSGKKELKPGGAEQVAKEIIARGKCEIMMISMGRKGALLVTNEITELITAPSVIRRSTVGAGDSMLAGIIFYLSNDKSILEAAKYGVACGTAATMNAGTELCRKEDAERLYELM